jgi:hypothetical protein
LTIAASLARTLGRPRLCVGLGALNLGVALLFTVPFSAALAPLVDTRPAAAAMLAGDDGLAVELVADHPELLRLAAALVLAALLVHLLASSVAAAGVWQALVAGARGARPFAAACAQHAGRMLALALVALPLRLVPPAAAAGVWFALAPLFGGRGFAALAARASLGALAWGALWSLGTVTVDYACGLALARPSLPVGRALVGGVRLVRRRPGATARLVALSGGGLLAVTVAGHALAWPIPLAPAAGFAALTVLRLLTIVARATIAAATLTAAAALADESL